MAINRNSFAGASQTQQIPHSNQLYIYIIIYIHTHIYIYILYKNYVDMLGNYAFFGAHGPLAVGPPAKRQSFANQAVVKYLATKWPERGGGPGGNMREP